ncbi:Dal82p LALA0_S05e05182g [Lachancea lanzarotensis]|uniref:LALA0S05e05182g1_1 n=1 Tax=Lachancea lanzarotensis TaxID=1245769 RepID=A0A0C7N798_9SACH|nr:uncharacterized protein LALA0_S05e05182g [Lachancea lanzarotensis]CEP62417.1 LALA0S05e05182g1_1 [Lachancea lanzarotensis]
MSNPDDMLLELMYEYKPHLQSYRHRLNTWNELLQAFNKATGANYRQSRTLKTRFEKVKELFVNGEQLPFKNVALLQKLLDECGQDTRLPEDRSLSEQYQSSEQSNTPFTLGNPDSHENSQKQQPLQSLSQRDTEFLSEGEDQDASRLPPLDSITIFPHTQMQRFQEQRFAKDGGYVASEEASRYRHGQPFHPDTSGSHYIGTKEHIAAVLESLKSDFQNNNSLDHSSEDINSLAALRNEVAILKHNQEIFQTSVLAKLDNIAKLLHSSSDFPKYNSQFPQGQGHDR